MKVTPSNQTLILAGEREPFAPRSQPAPDGASTEAVLQRLTIVAARPDKTLWYVEANYQPNQSGSHEATSGNFGAMPMPQGRGPTASRQDALPTASSVAPRELSALDSLRVPGGAASGSARAVGLYASTQNILADAPASSRLDVHA